MNPTLDTWFADTLTSAPTLMLVLAVLVVLPPLALAGVMLRRQRRSPDSTRLISRPSLRDGSLRRAGMTARSEVSAWPTEAWVEVGGTGQRHVIGRAMLRIGREADNFLPPLALAGVMLRRQRRSPVISACRRRRSTATTR